MENRKGAKRGTRRVFDQPGGQGHRGFEEVLRKVRVQGLRRRCFAQLADREKRRPHDRSFSDVEKNILTFNPGWDSNAQTLGAFSDVRELQRQLKAQGVELRQEANESTTGPPASSPWTPMAIRSWSTSMCEQVDAGAPERVRATACDSCCRAADTNPCPGAGAASCTTGA